MHCWGNTALEYLWIGEGREGKLMGWGEEREGDGGEKGMGDRYSEMLLV